MHSALEFRIQTISNIVTSRQTSQTKNGKRVTRKRVGIYAEGVLVWGSLMLKARSGPWGKGSLPVGSYVVGAKNRDWLANPSNAGMKVKLRFAKPNMFDQAEMGLPEAFEPQRVAFFVPIFPEDPGVKRGDFGIHPDGNVTGTAGCIGLVEHDADRFWTRWKATPELQRPTKLMVSAADASVGTGGDWTSTKAGKE